MMEQEKMQSAAPPADGSYFICRTRCPACGKGKSRPLLQVPFKDPRVLGFLSEYYQGRINQAVLDAATFCVLRCDHCDLLYQQEILSPLGMQKLYDDWIDPDYSLKKRLDADARYFAQLSNEVLGISRLVRGLPRETRVLDFGMGWGHWVRMASAHGYDCCGLELSRIRADYSQKAGLVVVNSLAELSGSRFNYIYANQVLEHVPEPGETLRAMTSLLAPGGVIDLHVPNQFGIQRRLSSKAWRPSHDAIHPLEHINCFSRRSLAVMAGQYGLRLLKPPFPHGRTPGTLGIRDLAVHAFNLSVSTHVFLGRA